MQTVMQVAGISVARDCLRLQIGQMSGFKFGMIKA